MEKEKPKSIRAIRRERKREPKLVEGVKNTLFLRGNKTSADVTTLFKDLRALRRTHAALFARKHDIHPFESREELEKVAKKADTSLFLFGSHNKKRPNNVVLGRTYEHRVLDMAELGILKLDSIESLVASAEIPFNAQPFLVFQGDLWESDEQLKKLRNLINDFFLMNNRLKGAEIDALLRVVVCWSVTDDRRLHLNVFEVTVEGGSAILNEEGKLVIEQLGPNAVFAVRRQSYADEETFKKATFVPKPKKKKENKNIKYDSLGNKRGKLYVDRQNLNALPFKKRKLINKDKTERREAGEIVGHAKHEDEFGQ